MKTKDADFLKVYILLAYFILVGLLAVYAFSSYSGEVGFILSRLTPHLMYIPLVLTALWYPQKKAAHIFIFLLIVVVLAVGYLIQGWSLDIIFTIFISLIYLWVYFAILLVPEWKPGSQEKDKNFIELPQKSKPCDKNGAYESYENEEVNGSSGCHEIFPEQIEPLIESFCIRDDKVLANTCRSIKALGPPAETYLLDALKNPDPTIRENSAKILGEIGSEKAVSLLIEAMDDESKRMHNASLQALARIGEPAKVPLTVALSDRRWRVRAGSCAALRILGAKDYLKNISPLLFDENHYVRKEAAKSLGRLGDISVSENLCIAINDESRGVRLACASALGRIKDPCSVEHLLNRYKSETDPFVRRRIVESLCCIGGEKALSALKYATYDSDQGIRCVSKEYIYGKGHSE
ncbi:HEAT repeat protein [Methanomicrobium sp. W14]|uniref:HEAT repeat domain-containing protein n=1 Tax=Methanomicrobium sp. W14 TaxID=2817839 RepID=UPI001AE72401|nr:HEAT repeat domain-containing protein [Methanomicrobium sp. W14]MBP2133633.1 HEAT repeat protein [Methanomicrobium sp. W14]